MVRYSASKPSIRSGIRNSNILRITSGSRELEIATEEMSFQCLVIKHDRTEWNGMEWRTLDR